MSPYDLPTKADIGGVEYDIRSDYRAALDAIQVMADRELDDEERTVLVLSVFYPDFDSMPPGSWQEAVDYVYWFIGGGKRETGAPKPRLMDWEQDFPIICAPVNRVLGTEVRALGYMHWWTFLSAYGEIGDCTFAQVVSIRKKRQQGKKLDKADEAFYRQNRELVDLKRPETASEAAAFDEWIK